MSTHGPNVTKLIIRFIAREAIPPGGGLPAGLEFFTNPERRKLVLAKAELDAAAFIQAFKIAPDNPFGNDDEAIAGFLLSKIEERLHQLRRVVDENNHN